MTRPLSNEELMRLEAELDPVNPRPHPSLPVIPAPGSNIAYVSEAENARLVGLALAMGLGRFQAR